MKVQKLALILGALAVLALVLGCTAMPSGPVGLMGFTPLDDSKATPQGVAATVAANNQFAIDYYNKIDSSGNPDYASGFFFSPFSISTALAMAYEGADGNTATQMQNVFYFPTDDTTRQSAYARIYNQFNSNMAGGNYTLSIANAMWPSKDYNFRESYFSTIKNYYYGNVTPLDFAGDTEGSRQTINSWVSERTRDKIINLLPPGSIDGETAMVLTNAIYFKGDWKSKFKTSDTKDAPFYTSANTQVTVQMMSQGGKAEDFNYAEDENFQYLQMPYKGDKLSMLVILPKGQQQGRFGPVDPATIPYSFQIPWAESIEAALGKMYSPEISVSMPKFKFETKYEMAGDLAEMGMPEAFEPGVANFSKMDPLNNLYISRVIHKAFVAVDEEGTEAAAATAIVMEVGAAMPLSFNANHPFAFAIIDNDTHMILFMGKVANPSKLTAES